MITHKLFIFLATLSLLLAFADGTWHFSTPKNWVQGFFRPALVSLHEVGLKFYRTVDFFLLMPKIYRENQDLKTKIVDLAYLKIENEKLKEENLALRNQLSIQGVSDRKLLPARVLGEVILGAQVFLPLDKGSKNGVLEGKTVVLGKNLIGKIARVLDSTSFIEPIFSSKSQVNVEVGTQKAKGVVEGELNSSVRLTQVLQGKSLQIGDLILTTGSEGVYPPDLLVGELTKIIKQDWEIYQGGELKLFWNPQDLETVFVIL